MTYTDILKDSARLFWRARSLWLLGVLAAFFGHGEYRFSVSYSENVRVGPGGAPPSLATLLDDGPVAALLRDPIPYIVAAVALALVWAIVALLLGWLAQGALIAAVAETGDEAAPPLRMALSRGRARMLPLVTIAILLALPIVAIILLVLAIVGPILWRAFSSGRPDLSMLGPSIFLALMCGLPLVLIGVLGGLVLRLVNTIAARSCVLEGLGARASIRRAWELFRRNLGYTLLTWVLLGVLGSVFAAVAAVPALALLIPSIRALLHGEWTPLSSATLAGLVVYSVVMNVGVGGVLTSFNAALWTKLYQMFLAREAAAAG